MSDLKKTVMAEMEKHREAVKLFPWDNKAAYALWLAQTYHIVKHSTRLVALAGGCAPLEQNDLHARFVDHAREERGHQMIAVSDLKALGYGLEDFPCLDSSAALAQIQYYWIQHRSVFSFFGYILSLEVMATEFIPGLYPELARTYGKNATNFLRVHGEDDVEHTEKAFQQLGALPPRELALVEENLRISAGLYRAILMEARDFVVKAGSKRVA